jgi:hypothetical protein
VLKRTLYVSHLNEVLEKQHVIGNAQEKDGMLIYETNDAVIRYVVLKNLTDPKFQDGLCASGFKEVRFESMSGVWDGSNHPVECKAERDKRLHDEALYQENERASFVSGLQSEFDGNPDTKDMHLRLEQQNGELILTTPAAKELGPQMLKALVNASFGGGVNSGTIHLCAMGFRGFRTRSSPDNKGVFTPLNCNDGG